MATLDTIIGAAAKVFRIKGYHAATVQDIADEVGLLKGSLYHHCAGKEELLYLVVKEPISRLYATVDAIVAAELPAAESCAAPPSRISRPSTATTRICSSTSARRRTSRGASGRPRSSRPSSTSGSGSRSSARA